MGIFNFRDVIDVPLWRPETPGLASTAAGDCLAWDNRGGIVGLPYIYRLRGTAALDALDPTTGDWIPLPSPALTGTFGAGACAVMHPSQGPRGTINGTGATTSKLALTTALPATVSVNQLANRGDGVGHRIRVIGLTAGKVEERTIVANSAGTTPTLWLDAPLSFVPTSTDLYEIRSGRLFMLSAGTLAAGMWKYYDCATNSISGNLTTTNLPATVGTDSAALALSESYVPNDRNPGEGFVAGAGTSDGRNCIVSTGTNTSTTLNGSGMPADLVADEYRTFQVRIVEDATAPAAVGQRRRISTHTAGAAGVFTVSTAWTTTPSNVAKFVVENDDDKILLTSSAAAFIYNYNITGNTWDTSTWAVPAAPGAGCGLVQAFGTSRDTTNNHRHSHIFRLRGGNVAAIDQLDMAAAATGVWSNDFAYGSKAQAFNTGTCVAYDPITLGGRFMHINVNGTQRFMRFDMRNRIIDPGTYLRFPQGTAVVGGKLAFANYISGSDKLSFLYHITNTQAQVFSLAIQR